MSLLVSIGGEARAAIQAIKDTSLSLNEQKAVLKSLQVEYAKLSTEQARGAIGKELSADIKIANEEIKRLGVIGTSSFGAIGQGAGKAFGAVRQLAYILPGIGIAGILGFAGEFIGSLFGIGEAADKTAKKIQELLKPIEDLKGAASAGAEEELAKVRALSTIVQDQTKSYKDRNAALNELKEINKSYFGDLSLEESKLGLLKQRVDEYTQAIINQAIVKAFSDEIGKLAVELSTQERAFNAAGKEVEKFKQKLVDVSKEGKTIAGTALPVISPEATKGLIDANDNFSKQGKIVGQLRDRMFELREEIQKAVETGLQFKPLKITDPEKIKDETNSIIAQAKRIQDALGLFKIDRITGLDDLPTQLKKAKVILDTFSRTASDSFFQIDIPIGVDVVKSKSLIGEQLKNPRLIFGDLLQLKIALSIDDKAKADLKKQLDSLNAIVNTSLESMTTAFAEGIGNLIAGVGSVGDIFGGIFKSIGAGLEQLGKAMVAHAIAIIAFKNAFKNPFVELAAGAALIIAGAAVQASIGRTQKFAAGGLVFGPTLGLVGEGPGTNRSNPEVIAPLDKLKSMLGGLAGNNMTLSGQFKIAGNDLLLAIARNQSSQLRTT